MRMVFRNTRILLLESSSFVYSTAVLATEALLLAVEAAGTLGD